jgi:hypothetical protein
MGSLLIFCKNSSGEILALASTPDGGAQGFAWRDGSWVKASFDFHWNSISLSRDEVILLIGKAAVEALPSGS